MDESGNEICQTEEQIKPKPINPNKTRAGSLAVRTGSWTIFLTSCLHSQQLLF